MYMLFCMIPTENEEKIFIQINEIILDLYKIIVKNNG